MKNGTAHASDSAACPQRMMSAVEIMPSDQPKTSRFTKNGSRLHFNEKILKL